jgi:protein involved in polysaccharide export with SLBB domain
MAPLTPEITPPPTPPPDPFTMALPIFGQSLFERAATETQPPQAAPVSPAYVLGPGDVLRLRLWTGAVQQITGDVPVDNDGNIFLDNIGRVGVQGISLSALRTLLQQRYERLYQDFTLEVTVSQMRTVDVFVIGEVRQPGKYTLPGNATVFTALFAAGGPLDSGSLRNIRLTRADQSLQTIDMYDYLLRGQRVVDVPLQPADTVFVPVVGPLVGAAGSVRRAAMYELKGAQNLEQVLAMAGGLLPRAYAPRVQVRRFAGNRTYQTMDVDLAQPGVATGFLMQDGDRVVAEEVTDLLTNAVTLTGEVYRPGTYELRPGLTLSALLQDAEGLAPTAYNQWGTLRRLNRKTAQYEDFVINPLLALQGQAGYDLPLQARDVIVIYNRKDVEGDLKILVQGSVRLAGEVDYTEGMTVKDAILRAGGLTPDALTNPAQLVRVRADMSQEVLAVNLDKALTDDPAQNLRLLPHDHLLIAARTDIGAPPTVIIGGQVTNPGEYRRYENMKLSDLLLAAGGVLPGADGVVKVIHGRYTDKPVTETASFAVGTALPGVTPDLALRDDDFVAVMGTPEFIQQPATVQLIGQVGAPGPYALLHPALHPEGVWDLLQRAGGLLEDAYGPGIVVYRRSESLFAPQQHEQYEHVMANIDSQGREIKLDTAIRAPAAAPVAGAAAPPVPAALGSTLSPAAPAPPTSPTPPTAAVPGAAPGAPAAGAPAAAVPGAAPGAPAAGAPAVPTAPTAAAPTTAMPATAPTPSTGTAAPAAPAPTPSAVEQVTLGLAEAFTTNNAVTIVVPPRELANIPLGKALPVDWRKMQATQGRLGDVILRDGDVIYIPTRPTLILVAGAVQNQGPLRYEAGLRIQDAIDEAGGLAKDAVLRSALVIHVNGQTRPARMRDAVQPGDVVIVPTKYIIQNVATQSSLERILGALANAALAFRLFK